MARKRDKRKVKPSEPRNWLAVGCRLNSRVYISKNKKREESRRKCRGRVESGE